MAPDASGSAVAMPWSLLLKGVAPFSSGDGGLALFGQQALDGRDFVTAADDERRPDVEAVGNDGQDPFPSVGGGAPGGFREEGEGSGLVEKTQLAVGILRVSGIEEDTAAQERAMEVGH